MPVPTGPMRLRCAKCGSTQWIPGNSDVVWAAGCTVCDGTAIEPAHQPFPIPRILWSAACVLIEMTRKR